MVLLLHDWVAGMGEGREHGVMVVGCCIFSCVFFS